jgi:hypothetical protein
LCTTSFNVNNDKLTAGIVDTGGKFTAGVNETGGHILREIYTFISVTSGRFAAGLNDNKKMLLFTQKSRLYECNNLPQPSSNFTHYSFILSF